MMETESRKDDNKNSSSDANANPSIQTTVSTTTMIHGLGAGGKGYFVEYLQSDKKDDADLSSDSRVEVLVFPAHPEDCSRIIKALSHTLKLPRELLHLKRVKKETSTPTTTATISQEDGPATKRHKNASSLELQILLGRAPLSTLLDSFTPPEDAASCNISPADYLIQLFLNQKKDGTDKVASTTTNAVEYLRRHLLHTVSVPGRPPQSQEEATQANLIWPTHYYPLKTPEYKRDQLAIQPLELQKMRSMVDRLSDTEAEAIVVDPDSFSILSRSGDEGQLQGGLARLQRNPLATPVLLAIQGVARSERQGATEHYLCSGYHLYCNYEPSVFESMAIVHSRMGRIVWKDNPQTPCPPRNIWRQGLSRHSIHCLPGTNHHFRAMEFKKREAEEDESSST